MTLQTISVGKTNIIGGGGESSTTVAGGEQTDVASVFPYFVMGIPELRI